MKLKIVLKSLSLALASALLVGTSAAVPASAVSANLSKNDEYLNVAGLNVSKETLLKLSEMSDVPGVTFGTSLLLDNIWGGDSSSNELLKHMDEQFAAVTDKLDDISTQMSNLLNQISNENEKMILNTRIQAYQDFVRDYKMYAQGFAGDLQDVDTVTDEAARKTAQKKFLQNVYNSNCGGHGAFTMAVITLGDAITGTDYMGGLDLLSAFDELSRYTYKWEHQGYAARERFQADVIGLYTYLAAIDRLALSEAILDNLPENESGISPQTTLKNLDKMTKNVSELAQKKAVVERPSYLKYYQVPGHECLLYTTVKAGEWDDWSTYDKLLLPYKNMDYFGRAPWIQQFYSDLMNPYFNEVAVKGCRPSAEWLKEVYNDYGEHKTLWDIFFSDDMGGLKFSTNLPYVPNVKPGFLTANDSELWRHNNVMRIYDTIIDTDGTVNKHIKLREFDLKAKWIQGKANGEWLNSDYCSLIFLIVAHQGVTPVDYVPETFPTQSHTPSYSSSSTGLASGSTSVSQANTAVSNPKTSESSNIALLWIPAALAALISAPLFRKKFYRSGR